MMLALGTRLRLAKRRMIHPRIKKVVLAALLAFPFLLAFFSLRALIQDVQQTDYYSHIPLVPLISAYFLFRHRKELFANAGPLFLPGLLVMAAGLGLYLVGRTRFYGLNDTAALLISAVLIFSWGSYLFLFGTKALRSALFPLAFPVFAVPVPIVLMEKVVAILVWASTGITHLLFSWIGVPFVQEGAVFYLPGFSLEVAKECSGIRSSVALLITAVIAAHLFLKKFDKQALLALAVFPVAVFKNGVRIVTLYLLSYFVDMRIIEGGFLHKSGGFIFFGMGLVIMGFLLWILRGSNSIRSESNR